MVYLASGGAVLYRDSEEMFSDSPLAMNIIADNLSSTDEISRKDFLTEADLGLYMFIEWFGSLLTVFFMVIL